MSESPVMDLMASNSSRKPRKPENAQATAATPAPSSPLPTRPLRKQVSRACDWCRARRIKCDNSQPCRACRQRGVDCTSKGGKEARTLAQALREIDRLTSRIRELEAKIKEYEKAHSSDEATSCSSSDASPGTGRVRPSPSTESQSPVLVSSYSSQWRGVFTATARSDQKSYYGPSSMHFYMSRVGTHLSKSLQQSLGSEAMQLRGMNKKYAYIEDQDSAGDDGVLHCAHITPRPNMNRVQEEYFLSLFWESYYCSLPIVNKDDFSTHYASLWDTNGQSRKDSALVDIVLALCIQFGFTLMPRGSAVHKDSPREDDPTISGRWYYRRCQALLTCELESPTITALQCQIYSIVYLCCASFQNMAHVNLAKAIRTAQILGLHLEPHHDLPFIEREMRKRIWWCLYAIETKTCLKLGRNMAIYRSQITTSLCCDSPEAAFIDGSPLKSPGRDITWLTYSVQCQKLIWATSEVHDSLYEKAGEMLAQRDGTSFYQDKDVLEICAETLASRMTVLDKWKRLVPRGLLCKRLDGNEPLSTGKCVLEFETGAPLWLQRQRTYLELMYHTLLSNLYRPFIQFNHDSSAYTPTSESHATAAVRHAITHINVMYQAVIETDLLNGWHEYFIWQWNAAVTTIGFVLAYPIHPCTPEARKALERAIAVFDMYAANFAVAKSAAAVARDLTTKADLIAGRMRNAITSGNEEHVQNLNSSLDGNANDSLSAEIPEVRDESLAWLNKNLQDEENYYNDFMDWAATIDSWNSFESLYDIDINGPSPMTDAGRMW